MTNKIHSMLLTSTIDLLYIRSMSPLIFRINLSHLIQVIEILKCLLDLLKTLDTGSPNTSYMAIHLEEQINSILEEIIMKNRLIIIDLPDKFIST